MSEKPVVYILHGDDDYAIAQFIAAMEAKLGDPGMASMNIARFDKVFPSFDELDATIRAMPFLAERRLVILHDPLAHLHSKTQRARFTKLLEDTPPTTALVLAVTRPLVSYADKKKNKRHWLQKWAAGQSHRVYEREFYLARGHDLVRWIQQRAKEQGGEITPEGAAALAALVGDTPRQAAQEIEKLLAYTNYSRAIEPDDVEYLVASWGEGDVFAMVDALGNRQGGRALRMLRHLLEDDDSLRLFGMIVRQFRLLLLTRALLDAGFREGDISRELKTHPFVIKKIIPQTRNFTLDDLEAIYRRLLDIDEQIKQGRLEGDVALDVLITALAV